MLKTLQHLCLFLKALTFHFRQLTILEERGQMQQSKIMNMGLQHIVLVKQICHNYQIKQAFVWKVTLLFCFKFMQFSLYLLVGKKEWEVFAHL